jgi:predicted RNase H-like HicB family nuclease
MKNDWNRLTRLQKGAFGEQYAKMLFTRHDAEVYSSDIDDRGIDFVARFPGSEFYEVQVKTVTNMNLAYINEDKFKRSDRFLVVLIRLEQSKEPKMYVFRGNEWDSKDGLLKYKPYTNAKSQPAYEIHLSQGRIQQMGKYRFEKRVAELRSCASRARRTASGAVNVRTAHATPVATDEVTLGKENYTAIIKQSGPWWIGWIEEVPGVNCQEVTKADLLERLRETLREALEFNRREALEAAGDSFEETSITI